MNNNQQPGNKLYQIGTAMQSLGCIGCMLPLVIIFGGIFILAIWGMITSIF